MAGTKPKNFTDRQRAVEAMGYRTKGKTWQWIADELGYYDASTALKATRNLITRTERESVEEWRETMSQRYEYLLAKAVEEIDAADAKGQLVGKAQMMTTARGILDSQVRLLGVAVNQKVELSGEVKVGNKDLDAAIDRALEILSRGTVTEGAFPQVAENDTEPQGAEPVSDPETRRSPNAHEPGCVLLDGHDGPCIRRQDECLTDGCLLNANHSGQHTDGTEVWE